MGSDDRLMRHQLSRQRPRANPDGGIEHGYLLRTSMNPSLRTVSLLALLTTVACDGARFTRGAGTTPNGGQPTGTGTSGTSSSSADGALGTGRSGSGRTAPVPPPRATPEEPTNSFVPPVASAAPAR